MFNSRSCFAFALSVGMFSSVLNSNHAWSHEGHTHADGQDHSASAEKKITDAMATLAAEDRKLAEAQRFCPMMEYSRLGAMGEPVKMMIDGKPIFVCCKECAADAEKGGKATVTKVAKLKQASAVLAKLSAEDRMAAEAQKYCPIADGSLLGGMGAPIKVNLNGTTVLLCCKGCESKAKADPAATLTKVELLKNSGLNNEHHHDHAEPNVDSK